MAIDTPVHTSEPSIDRVLNAGLPVLLVFERKDCPPCQQLEPELNRLATTYAGKALIARVDTQDNPVLAKRYAITQLPGLVFVKDSQTIAQAAGAAPESTLRSWMEHLVNGGPRPALPSGPSIPLSGAATTTPPPRSTAQPQARPAGPPPGPASGSAVPVTLSDATFDQVLRQSGNTPVLVDFWAPWCGPCRIVAPTVERLAQEFAGRAIVGKLNVDENPNIAQRLGISGIPALFVFQRGQVVERLIGAQPAPVIRQALARHVGN